MDHKLRGLQRDGNIDWNYLRRHGLDDEIITSGEMQGPPDLDEAICEICKQPGIQWADCHHCLECHEPSGVYTPKVVIAWSLYANRRYKSDVQDTCIFCHP